MKRYVSDGLTAFKLKWITRYSMSVFILLMLLIQGCSTPGQSLLLYRVPYDNGTDLCVSQDHLTHSPVNRVDLRGINGSSPYPVVAAQTGIVRIIVDNLSQNCCGGSCGNNYVWLEHLGGEWTKYTHLATGSVRGDAGLSENDIVVTGTFIGFESDVGRACGSSTCDISNGVHLHFEVGVPNDPANPVSAGNGGFINGSNRIPRFCGVQGQTLVQGRNETAIKCDLLLNCIQSQQSPSTQGQCEAGLDGDICVQEINNVENTSTYNRGEHFNSSSVKIDLDWCPDATCNPALNTGRAVQVVVIPEDSNADPIEFVANCQNRRVLETVHDVQQIIIQKVPPNLGNANTICNGNESMDAFARWEICDIPTLFAP